MQRFAPYMHIPIDFSRHTPVCVYLRCFCYFTSTFNKQHEELKNTISPIHYGLFYIKEIQNYELSVQNISKFINYFTLILPSEVPPFASYVC
jgi:hypothetical protein